MPLVTKMDFEPYLFPSMIVNCERNVEDIRQKNLEDNQLFLKNLLMPELRNDFLQSARSLVQKKENIKIPNESAKIEYPTRYNTKVKSGEIRPHVPKWRQEIKRKFQEKEQQRKEKEERLLEKELRKVEGQLQIEGALKITRIKGRRGRRNISKWKLLYKDNANPYQRVYKPR